MIKHLPFAIVLFLLPIFSFSQTDTSKAAIALVKSNTELDQKAAGWAAGLKLTDTEKEKRVASAIALHCI